MKAGQPQEVVLNYSSLYKLNPETARVAVLEVFKQTGNISKTARMFSTTRKVIHLAIKKGAEGMLADKSHVAKVVHNKTRADTAEKVLALKNTTMFGYRRIAKEMKEKHSIAMKESTALPTRNFKNSITGYPKRSALFRPCF